MKLHDVICSLVLRRGFLIRCAILVNISMVVHCIRPCIYDYAYTTMHIRLCILYANSITRHASISETQIDAWMHVMRHLHSFRIRRTSKTSFNFLHQKHRSFFYIKKSFIPYPANIKNFVDFVSDCCCFTLYGLFYSFTMTVTADCKHSIHCFFICDTINWIYESVRHNVWIFSINTIFSDTI